MTRQELKTEAIARLKKLELFDESIKQFEKEDIISYTYPNGAIYWLDDEMKEIVEKFEKEYNCLVYHIIESFTNFGHLYNILYVSQYTEEWEMENEDIEEGYVFAYVENVDAPFCSEFGSIGVKNQWGGLVRAF